MADIYQGAPPSDSRHTAKGGNVKAAVNSASVGNGAIEQSVSAGGLMD